MRFFSFASFVALCCTLLMPTAGAAQESHIYIVVAIEGRTPGDDIVKTRAKIDALAEPLHRCFWERKTTSLRVSSDAKREAEWRLTAKAGTVRAEQIVSLREDEIDEKAVLQCFARELEKAKLEDGRVRVLLTFRPIGLQYPRVKLQKFKFVGKRPDKRLATMIERQVRAHRQNLCPTSYSRDGVHDARIKLLPNGGTSIDSKASALLSCVLGMERSQAPIPSGTDPIEFEATVKVSKGADRRPFDQRELLAEHNHRRLDEDEVRVQTQFGDVDVWRHTGRTSTNQLRSLCMAVAERSDGKRFATACQIANCECSTDFYDDDWGEYCESYKDAGRPDRAEFVAQMLGDVLRKHDAALSECGDECASGAKEFRRDCAPFFGGEQ